MVWNWQHPLWPQFTWNTEKLSRAERLFSEHAGLWVGCLSHLPESEQDVLTLEMVSSDAVHTSALEGEFLDRESIQASIRRQLGLVPSRYKAHPAEEGIAEMMVDLFKHLEDPLDHSILFEWHRMISNGRRDLRDIGCYRTHQEPMQIVSGPEGAPRLHFEAPPSLQVHAEMERFLVWFQETQRTLPPLTRAGLAHLWFESIHPFEDGNGRIGRALIEKALAQGLSAPIFTAVAGTLLKRRKEYYQALEYASGDLEATPWLLWFSAAVLEAQKRGLSQVDFILHKAKILSRMKDFLNPRQEKVVVRLFEAGPDGFKGGLSSDNYRRITRASTATATRDLAGLVELGVLVKTGERKSTRYNLAIPIKAVETVHIEDIL